MRVGCSKLGWVAYSKSLKIRQAAALPAPLVKRALHPQHWQWGWDG